MVRVQIVALAGSTRKDSFNKMLVKIAAAGARESGAEVIFVDLKDYPLPLYDGDLELEHGIPENGLKLKKLFSESHGLIIASPEYNSSMSGVLKNTIDWISRPAEGEKSLASFDGKVAAIMSASPGGLGGMRGLVPLRSLLSNIKVMVLPDQISIGQAHEAFNDDGSLRDQAKQNSVKGLGKKLFETALKLNHL